MDFVKSTADRYIVADVTMGCTVDVLENHVSYLCREYPDHKKIFLLDNFHKLDLKSTNQRERTSAISEGSNRLKNISLINDIPIITTIELRKLANETDRPTRQDMSGANRLDYDADVVGLVHCDQQVHKSIGRESKIVHDTVVNGEVRTMPWVEVNIAKNKLNGKQGTIPMKFNDHNMQLTQGRFKDWNALYRSTITRNKGSNDF
ncbi:MAG: hypothetical protein GY861_26955 [bacterium]|nr:hypothetical protein [bacterium]